MFEIDEQTRIALFDACVLTTDDAGAEVFTGLTAEESHFVFTFEQSEMPLDSADECRFHQLVQKFHAARTLVLQQAEALTEAHLNLHRVGQTSQ